jgi:membrane associated rhomboid family serine protease
MSDPADLEPQSPDPLPTWSPLRVTGNQELGEGWALVLESQAIPNHLERYEGAYALWVPDHDRIRAEKSLAAYDRERRAEAAAVLPAVPDQGWSAAGLAMVVVLGAFFWVTGGREDGDAGRWFREGTAVAELILHGQAFRAITALTLHADAAHLFGNAVATLIFVGAAGRWLGSGLALLATLSAGALGNLVVALSYGSGHHSVGASTATFGALGLLGGLQIVRWIRQGWAQGGRRGVMAVIAACMGVFAMLGVGEKSDVRAHLFGLAAGVLVGALLGRFLRLPMATRRSHLCGLLAAGALAGAWALAFRI